MNSLEQQKHQIALPECNDYFPGHARPIMHTQATKMTRQELRKYSPTGAVQMDSMRGRSFTYPFLVKTALLFLAALAAINSMLPQGW